MSAVGHSISSKKRSAVSSGSSGVLGLAARSALTNTSTARFALGLMRPAPRMELPLWLALRRPRIRRGTYRLRLIPVFARLRQAHPRLLCQLFGAHPPGSQPLVSQVQRRELPWCSARHPASLPSGPSPPGTLALHSETCVSWDDSGSPGHTAFNLPISGLRLNTWHANVLRTREKSRMNSLDP